MLCLIDLNSNDIFAISNADIDPIRDLGLSNIKKYWRYTGRIKEEVNRLYKN